MHSPHHNVFWYYRGPTRRGAAEELQVDRQVEDNTTKALINVLEHSDRDVLSSFVQRFVSSGWKVSRDGKSRFYLQRGPDGQLSKPRILLGISPVGQIEPGSFTTSGDSPGRIDAAIEPAGGGLIVIEVKTASELDGAQLMRHAVRWSIERPVDPASVLPDSWRLVGWADVWRWAREQQERLQVGVSEFLLVQLTEYLGVLGLAPWSGFQSGDFQVFDHDSYEARAILKNRLSGLWERVLEQLDPADRARLGTVHVGRFGATADHAWAQTNRGEEGVNLTLELYASELQLNVVAWNKALARRVEQWLERQRGQRIPLELVIHERHASVAGGRPNWRAATHTPPVARFSPDEVAGGAFALWREQWMAQHDSATSALAYHLRQRWSRQEVLGRAEGIAIEVAEDVRRLLAVLREINRWD